jgi:hypothetical protein
MCVWVAGWRCSGELSVVSGRRRRMAARRYISLERCSHTDKKINFTVVEKHNLTRSSNLLDELRTLRVIFPLDLFVSRERLVCLGT